MKKAYAGLGLVLVVMVLVFALGSFFRENWAASQTPGVLERFLVRWVLSSARQTGAEIKNPLLPTEENLREGREFYEQQCVFCHGLDGRGQRPDGIQFYPPVPSLVERDNELTDGQRHFIVSNGIRYTAMPSFVKVLAPEQIWKVILWLRHLSDQGQFPAGPRTSEK